MCPCRIRTQVALAEAILAHLEGLFVIAKMRNDPGVFERLPRDIGRLLALPP